MYTPGATQLGRWVVFYTVRFISVRSRAVFDLNNTSACKANQLGSPAPPAERRNALHFALRTCQDCRCYAAFPLATLLYKDVGCDVARIT